METYNLNTPRELFRILEQAIKDEDAARDTYTEAAQHTDDPEVKSFLMELVAMEQHHHVLLEHKLNEMMAVAEIQDEICEAYD